MDIITNYIMINYLDCLLKAVTSLRVSSGWQRQAAANFDVSPHVMLVKFVIVSLAFTLTVGFKKRLCHPV